MELNMQNSRLIQGKFIGKGSYGVVSLGVGESETFAVKSAQKDNLGSIEALENEIDVLKSLSSSPFIVEYRGDEETANSRKLFMEYIPGGDVTRYGRLDDMEIIRSYTWCLVSALQAVHNRGIVHCDIKGSNVLVDATTGIAKLADFGSSKQVSNSKFMPRGSPLWMAPEVIRGESQLYESDIWSLGCTVLEMFTGKPAWHDNGAHTLFKIGYTDELPAYPAQLPELGRDFLNKCLVREVGQRWSCDQLLQHPFLLPTPIHKFNQIMIYSSPRSILDWDNLDFSDDDNQESITPDDITSAIGRIVELTSSSGVNWESDGWIEVRNSKNETTSNSVTVNVTVSAAANSEFCINEAAQSGGDDGGDRCRQEDEIYDNDYDQEWEGEVLLLVKRREKNITAVTNTTTRTTMFLLISLYSSTSVGQHLIMLLILMLMKLIQIHCFWIKLLYSNSLSLNLILISFLISFHRGSFVDNYEQNQLLILCFGIN